MGAWAERQGEKGDGGDGNSRSSTLVTAQISVNMYVVVIEK